MSNMYSDWKNGFGDHTHIDCGACKKFQRKSLASWNLEAVQVNSRAGYSGCDV